ncbi:MAG: heme lyase CcmF/NrfE family subunit [Burkholderiaceae bacterium]
MADGAHFALCLALALSFALCTAPMVGAAREHAALMALADSLALALLLCVGLAFAGLAWSFLDGDFSLALVARHSNTQLPTAYRLAATWGSHEGSMLMWILMLCGWTYAVSRYSAALPAVLRSRVLAVLGAVIFAFILFSLYTSNPFERLPTPAAQGSDLNPLLQDPGMVFHPPLLYMGYVGFAVVFAFAIAALIGGQADAAWARWARPWTTAAWSFLTLGIALGSAWAYYELGWGGWWFWDPVENASFMPWLVGTALIHSLAMTEKRGVFRRWTLLLAIAAFSLSLLGTFLVRSGVLTSVHAFATDPRRGVFILIILSIAVGGSLLLYAWRAQQMPSGRRDYDLLSREGALLANNLMLSVAAASVLLGTLYPLALDAIDGSKISVGAPYFEAVFAPLMAPAVFLMALGPIMRWRQVELVPLLARLRWAAAVALVCGLCVPWLMGQWSFGAVLGFALAAWLAWASLTGLVRGVRGNGGSGGSGYSTSYFGMHLAHLGIAVFVVGVTGVKSFEQEQHVVMRPGEQREVAGLALRFDGTRDRKGPNFEAQQGRVAVAPGKDADAVLMYPEKRQYGSGGQPMTEAAINSGIWRDVYVSLGDPGKAAAGQAGQPSASADGSWTLLVAVKPFVNWIWWGCALMALGGFLAVADRRYRQLRRA